MPVRHILISYISSIFEGSLASNVITMNIRMLAHVKVCSTGCTAQCSRGIMSTLASTILPEYSTVRVRVRPVQYSNSKISPFA